MLQQIVLDLHQFVLKVSEFMVSIRMHACMHTSIAQTTSCPSPPPCTTGYVLETDHVPGQCCPVHNCTERICELLNQYKWQLSINNLIDNIIISVKWCPIQLQSIYIICQLGSANSVTWIYTYLHYWLHMYSHGSAQSNGQWGSMHEGLF